MKINSDHIVHKDDSPPLGPQDKKYIQQVVGSFLYYTCKVDMTILLVLSAITADQSKPTERIMERVDQLLDYMHSNLNAVIQFQASDMILNIHSDVSYMSASKGRSRAGGYFFLGSLPKNGEDTLTHLGKLFLPTMLEALVQFSAQPSSQLDVLLNCMSHLAACANKCPSLLAGGNSLLEAMMCACMSIAQINNSRDDEAVIFLKLSALNVFATITAVPQIKHSIMKLTTLSPCSVGEADRQSSPLLQFLIQGNVGGEQKGVLYLCAELAVLGVNDDKQAWSAKPA